MPPSKKDRKRQVDARKRPAPSKRYSTIRPGKRHSHPAFQGIVQGVGAVPKKNFGSTRPNPTNARALRMCMDATIPRHLTLPINTGPYTVIRTNTIVNSEANTMFFGFFKGAYNVAGQNAAGTESLISNGWAPYIAAGGSSDTEGPATLSVFYVDSQLDALASGCTLAPAAMTIQCMNPGALQSIDGIVYVGAAKNQYRLEDDNTPWASIGKDFVSYQTPRLCSAGKLSLRGVKVDAIPVNMAELMDFERIMDLVNGSHTGPYSDAFAAWTGGSATSEVVNSRWAMKGFAQIGAYNPDKVKLQYLGTAEWRVRFDYRHPASSNHLVQPAASTAAWDTVQRALHAAGHGAQDIVEQVAMHGATSLAQAAGTAMLG